jgi:hypothetical protein
MARPRSARFLPVGLVLVGACQAISGIDGLEVHPDASTPADAAMSGSEDSGGIGPIGDALVKVDGESDTPTPASCTCLAAPPMGWGGPVAVYRGPSASLPPTCAGAGAYGSTVFPSNPQLYADLAPAPAACTACACGAQQGAKCGAHLTYYTNPCATILGGCNGQDYGLLAGTCQALGSVSGGCAGRYVQSFTADAEESLAGSCPATGGMPSGVRASWNTIAVPCGHPGAFGVGSCAAGQVCASPSTAPFENLCVYMAGAGAQTCPGAPYAQPYVYYPATGFDDTRACSGCACSTPTVACAMMGTAFFYTDPACTVTTTPTSIALNNLNGMCQTLPNNSYYSTYVASFTEGSCTPSGGQATGTVTPDPTKAVTFCCTQ